jgi:hypothetical protein
MWAQVRFIFFDTWDYGLPDTLSRVSVDDCDAADVPFVLFAARLGLDASKMHSTVWYGRGLERLSAQPGEARDQYQRKHNEAQC